MSFVSHLECALCHTHYDAGKVQGLCLACQRPLWVKDEGKIKPEERIVIFNTGAAQKYPEAVQEKLPRLDISKPIDWSSI